MHERSCQIVAPPQTTGSGILNRYEQDDDQDDNQDDNEFRVTKSILKGVARSYILEFSSKEIDLHPRMQQGFANAYNAIKSLQRDEKNMKYLLSLTANTTRCDNGSSCCFQLRDLLATLLIWSWLSKYQL